MIRMNSSMAIQVAAQRLAQAEIRAQARRHGLRLPHTPAELAAQAKVHLAAHPELIEASRAQVEEWFAGTKSRVGATKSKA